MMASFSNNDLQCIAKELLAYSGLINFRVETALVHGRDAVSVALVSEIDLDGNISLRDFQRKFCDLFKGIEHSAFVSGKIAELEKLKAENAELRKYKDYFDIEKSLRLAGAGKDV